MLPYERLSALLAGAPADRAPRAMWRHWPGDDQSVDTFVDVLVDDHQRFGWDFVKVSPSSSHTAEPWGAQSVFRAEGMLGRIGEREYTRRAVRTLGEWDLLDEPAQLPASWSRQVEVVARLAATLPATPRLVSVFSPAAVFRYLCGDGLFLRTFRGQPATRERVLALVSSLTQQHVRRLVDAGADGIFYSTLAAADTFGLSEYIETCLPFDQAVMAPAADAFFNVLHLHGLRPHLEITASLPVSAVNWDTEGDVAALDDAYQYLRMPIIGGLDQNGLMVSGSAEQIAAEVEKLERLFRQTHQLMIGPGCASPVAIPIGNLKAVAPGRHGVGNQQSTPSTSEDRSCED